MPFSSISRPLLIAAVALLALTGLIHAFEAPDYFEEQTYVGVLFALNALGALIGVVALLRGAPRWAWLLGIAVAGGAFAGFILSRTTGLPSFKESEWEPLGIASLVIEAGFCLIAFRALVKPAPARRQPAQARRAPARRPVAGRS
jgi:4-amino-4-deoxy-L-arabinose transferase-like glycosyltransferase